jgi:hypothetical protein
VSGRYDTREIPPLDVAEAAIERIRATAQRMREPPTEEEEDAQDRG